MEKQRPCCPVRSREIIGSWNARWTALIPSMVFSRQHEAEMLTCVPFFYGYRKNKRPDKTNDARYDEWHFWCDSPE
jgi:hypothetical protein